MSEAPDVRIENVTKRYGDVLAVDDVSVEIARGSFFAMLGPSGCGKTTTLRMIGGFDEPTAGRILLGDQDVSYLPPYKRDVNTVFQSYALFPHLSIADNVGFGLREKKVPKAERVQRVGEALELVDLAGYERRKPRQLSGGQQQRVALARALVNRPRVLLLDEPLGALDLKLRRQMQLELKRIQQDVGITFVHVTHDQEEAMTMADQIAVMNQGRIEQLGGPTDLYERPATAFVAGFLGVSNLIPARIEDAATVSAGGLRLRVPEETLAGRSGEIQLGIRPEKIAVAASAAAAGDAVTLAGTVREFAYVGVATQYIVDTAVGEIQVFHQNVTPSVDVAAPGSEVVLTWDPQATFVVEG